MPFYNSEEKGRPIKIKDEGLTLVENVSSLDFAGDAVTGTNVGSEVTETIVGDSGGGDMLASTYDPTSVSGDAFDMDNMVQGDTNKFLSSAELTVVQNTSNTNTGDQSSSDFNLSDLGDVDDTDKAEGKILKVDGAGNHIYVADESGTDEKVKYDSGDPTAGYVADKVVAGDGISVAEGTGANENKLVITNTIDHCDEISIDTIGTPTFSTQCDFNKLFGSAGRATGGSISDAGSETVNVAAGTGFIKANDSDTDPLLSFNWSASNGISIPTNSVRYIGIEYNSGTPQVVTKETNTWDLDTEFPLGSVINQAGDLYINNNPWWITDGITNIIEIFQAEGYVVRDNYVGGLKIGTSSTNTTRKPTLTAGQVWSRLNEYAISPVDCSGADTFYGFYRNGSGGWTRTAAKTDIDDFYDNNSGTLQALDNNKYVNFWVFLEIANGLMVIYPQNQYNTSVEAENEDVPTFPTSWYEHGILVGRIIIKQGVTAPISVQTAFNSTFGYTLSADHGNLSGLSDDDHTQYLLANGTRAYTSQVITDNAIVTIDSTVVADNDYAKFTANGLEGRSYSEVRSDLGLVIGTNVQAYSANLDSLAGLTPGIEGNLIVADGLGAYQIVTLANFISGAAIAKNTLENLGTTAINTSLISDTDSTDDLGSSTKYWANLYTDKIYLNSTASLDGSTAGVVILTGDLRLPNVTHADESGIIRKGSNIFLHDFNYGNNGTVTTTGGNLFLGESAGNLTMGATATETFHASNNIILGATAFVANTIGYQNVSIGYGSMASNTEGYNNVALGTVALQDNTTGYQNFGLGVNCLADNTSGYRNIGVGVRCLQKITTGNNNLGMGYDAGRLISTGGNNTTATNSIYLGCDSRPSADGDANEIVIGCNARGNGSNSVIIGDSNITKTELKGSVTIGTSTPNASAILQSDSTSKGWLPPRMTGAQAEAISSPAEGLMVYATSAGAGDITAKGWWGFDGGSWINLG